MAHGIRTGAALLAALTIAASPACARQASPQQATPPAIDTAALMADLRALAADSMEGRAVDTPGSQKARRYLDRAFAATGLEPVGGQFRHPFPIERNGSRITGVNFIGRLRGSDTTGVIVVTAHYDHLGIRNGEVYNGADDNASGTAGLLAIARAMRGTTPRHTILFVATDAEEGGLRGARAFVDDPPVARDAIRLDINLDMVSRNDRGELWVAGTHHYPWLMPLVDSLRATAPVTLLVGHDVPGTGSDDWTSASDHGPFHAAGIPFLYFGVEDHPDYHRATDDPEKIDPVFYTRSVETVARALRMADRRLADLAADSRRNDQTP